MSSVLHWVSTVHQFAPLNHMRTPGHNLSLLQYTGLDAAMILLLIIALPVLPLILALAKGVRYWHRIIMLFYKRTQLLIRIKLPLFYNFLRNMFVFKYFKILTHFLREIVLTIINLLKIILNLQTKINVSRWRYIYNYLETSSRGSM